MHDIFISYAHEDQTTAARVAERFEYAGWSVWWDRSIPTGSTFDEVIEKAIDSSRCVIVLWSESSAGSRWVRTEAQEGLDRGVLLPVLLEETKIPLAFRRLQAASLIGWDGQQESDLILDLLSDVEALIGAPAALATGAMAAEPPGVLDRDAELVPDPGSTDPESRTHASAVEAAESDTRGSTDAKGASDERGRARPDSPADGASAWPKLVGGAVAGIAAVLLGWQFLPLGAPAPPPPLPTIDLRADAEELVRGDTTVLRWTAANDTSVQISPDIGMVATTGTASVAPNEDVTYRVVVDGPGGTVEKSVSIAVLEPYPPDDPLNVPIWIEGGTFQMGGRRADESPVHQVTVSSFWIQQHEVTNEEYRRFVIDHSFAEGLEDHPVRGVSWFEAVEYAQFVGGNLPTEAQWEFAARGTEGRMYPWGDSAPTCAKARFYGCAVGEFTAPVMAYPDGATPEGVMDIWGNVSEWVLDWYGPYSSEAVVDPQGPPTGEARVSRSGNHGVVSGVRGSYRFYKDPEERSYEMGFRVAWPANRPR